MGLTSEIYLTKKFISKEEWLELIKTISNYNGIFRRWKIIITNDRNQIRYFVKIKQRNKKITLWFKKLFQRVIFFNERKKNQIFYLKRFSPIILAAQAT